MDKINNANESLGLLERVLAITKKYSVLEIFKALAMLALVSVTISVVFYPERIFKVYDEYKARLHDKILEQRELYAPHIQTSLDRLRIITKADRALLLEYHNGTESLGGLPFRYADATFESLEDGVYSVASQYKDVNLTLMPFISHLNKHMYYASNVETLKEIDKGLMYKLLSNNVEHCAMIEVRGIEKPLGILVLTYAHPIDHDCRIIRGKIEQTALDIAVKLELKK